ncbi:MAG: hypothetical protein AAF702_17710 [Chloroflexota bacterium]
MTELDGALHVPSYYIDLAEEVIQQEYHDQLLTVIDTLPEHQRTVVALFYIGEYSQQVIG